MMHLLEHLAFPDTAAEDNQVSVRVMQNSPRSQPFEKYVRYSVTGFGRRHSFCRHPLYLCVQTDIEIEDKVADVTAESDVPVPLVMHSLITPRARLSAQPWRAY